MKAQKEREDRENNAVKKKKGEGSVLRGGRIDSL